MTAACFFLVVGSGSAQAQHARVSVRDSAAFIMTEVPDAPSELFESALRFTPSAKAVASTGSYDHAGGEYGLVVLGQVERRDATGKRLVRAGDSFISPPWTQSESRASRPAVQISAFWGPHGAVAKGAPLLTSLYRTQFFVPSIPPRPFTFVEQLVDIPSGGSTVRFSYGGEAFCTVANGEVAVESKGIVKGYRLGQSFILRAHELLRLTNKGKRLGSVHVVVFLPEAEHLTQPHRVY